MKRLMSVLAAAVVASGLLVAGAYAAKTEAVKGPPPESIKKGMTDAPAAVQAAGLSCTLKNAAWIGTGTETIDKKQVKGDNYEVACAEGPGYLITKLATGDAQSYTCIQLAAAAAGKGKGPQCTLPENQNLGSQIQPAVDHSGISCKVADVAFLGTGQTDHLGHYEISCGSAGGYLINLDTKGAASGDPTSCLQATSDPSKWLCKLTTKAQAVAAIGDLAKPLDPACQASDARFVGRDTSSKADYFEIGCSNKPGFMLQIDAGKPTRVIDCLTAKGIGGGCTLTDISKLKLAATSGFAGTLQQNNVPCTVTDSNIYGKEPATKRDVVEFKCAEQPWGLVAVIPGAGATGRFEHYDCLSAAERTIVCQLTTKAEILAKFVPILTAIEKQCEPTEFQMHGPDETDGDYVEVKCGKGQSGYILDLPADRSKTKRTLSCEQAGRTDDKCMIPGNA
jgi:hypothetical protein